MNRAPAAHVLLLALLTLGAARAEPQAAIPARPDELVFPPTVFELPSPEGRRVALPGGAVVYLAEDHSLPLVELTVGLPLGSALDPRGREGLAALAGALLRRGGSAAHSAAELDLAFDAIGAEADSTTRTSRGGASLDTPSWELGNALDLFFDLLRTPRFEEERLAAARRNLHDSLARRNQDALAILDREWQWLAYGPDHYSTRPVTVASVDAIRRDDLVAFHRRYWRPERMVLAVAGDFAPPELLARLRQAFSDWPSAPPVEDTGAQEASASGNGAGAATPPWVPRPGLFLADADIAQAKVALGQRLAGPIPWIDPDRPLLALLGEILGGSGAISRIAGRLRTAEGLVYRARADLDPGGAEPGELRIFFDTRPDGAAAALELCRAELDDLRRRPVDGQELEVARRILLAGLQRSFDTAEEVAGYLAEDELLGRPHDYWSAYMKGIAAATPADLLRVAARYLEPDRLIYLLVGPAEELLSTRGGPSALERATGHAPILLPARDPLTLAPAAAPGAPSRP